MLIVIVSRNGEAKANQIGLKCIVSDILKDEKKGIDLADMYIAEKTNDVNLLAEYFNNAQLPKELKIDSYTIKNVKSFIDESFLIGYLTAEENHF